MPILQMSPKVEAGELRLEPRSLWAKATSSESSSVVSQVGKKKKVNRAFQGERSACEASRQWDLL